MNREELEERQLEIANRMKNIIWTVCGDYTLEAKPDVEAFEKARARMPFPVCYNGDIFTAAAYGRVSEKY